MSREGWGCLGWKFGARVGVASQVTGKGCAGNRQLHLLRWAPAIFRRQSLAARGESKPSCGVHQSLQIR